MTEIIMQQGKSKVVMNSAGAHALRPLGRFATTNNELGVLVNQIAHRGERIVTVIKS